MTAFLNTTRRLLLWGALALLPALAQSAALRIAVTPGALADSVEVAATEARKAGLEVKVIEFTDWTTPNSALANGDVDLNYFQHQAFLDNAIKERGYKLKSVGVGVLNNLALFSKKIKRFDELKEGAQVAVANDPVNQGRGLLLLEKAGLIKLRPGVAWRGTLDDIVANPKKLRFVEVEGPQLVRAIDDVDLAQGYPSHFVNAGQAEFASRGLLYSDIDDLYFAIRFVSREDNAKDPRILQFVQIYQGSPAVKAQILKSYGNDSKLFVLPWVKP
ncbi:MAG: MetQ/NlpA family ABC transporter substrate-binding protein [Curvibacter sp.]|nr:MetQ/NlpA family ABC transporter substrate-binding protein [Curvibacter sp.]